MAPHRFPMTSRLRAPRAIVFSPNGPCYKTSVSLGEVLDEARRIATTTVRENSASVDEHRTWPEAAFRALQAVGLGGLVVPREAGGRGHGLLAVARVCDILGRECASTAISFGMHLVASAVIAAKATPTQRSAYLEPIARGEHITTLALSEPGTGAHFYLPQSTIADVDGRYLVSGTKSFVTNGGFADSYVVSAVPSRDDAAPGEFSCVMVHRDAKGLSWTGDWQGWGMRGNAARSAHLSEVSVPRSDLLGDEGDQIWFVFNVIAPFFLMAMAGTYLGVASAALDHARDHLTNRMHAHTGSSLAENQLLQHRLGELWARVQRTRALIFDAARMGDESDPDALLALCAAKAEVADTAERVTADAMTLVGGRGYATGHPLHRLYRDARAAHVMSPTTDLLRIWTGRAYLGLPLLGD